MSIPVGLGLIALSELLDDSESESPEILSAALDGALRDKISAFRREAEDENTAKLFKVKSRNPVDVLKGIIGRAEGSLF